MIPGDRCQPREPATQVSASRRSAAGAWSRQPTAEWLTPGRLMSWWPSPVTRKNVSAANFPVSGLPLSQGSLWPTIQPINGSTSRSDLLLRRLRLGLGAVQFPHRRTRRARADGGFGAVTGVAGFEGHTWRIRRPNPLATPIAQRLGFIFEAQPQSPAQPPSLRRRAAANQRRASQPTATPMTAPTMTASRFM